MQEVPAFVFVIFGAGAFALAVFGARGLADIRAALRTGELTRLDAPRNWPFTRGFVGFVRALPVYGMTAPLGGTGLLAAAAVAGMGYAVAPQFHVGQTVRARNIHPTTHTRLPRYARGKSGIVDRDHGVFVFPDSNAQGLGEKPQHVYSVRFTARELWGDQAKPNDTVVVNMWDDYLETV